MTRILAHAVGGGWDLRHEGCAPKCCERVATPTRIDLSGEIPGCGGCLNGLSDPPAPVTFDRDAPCEAHVTAGCDSCAMLTINGIPCHETGCPNMRHECRGCNERIPVRDRYCADCR